MNVGVATFLESKVKRMVLTVASAIILAVSALAAEPPRIAGANLRLHILNQEPGTQWGGRYGGWGLSGGAYGGVEISLY